MADIPYISTYIRRECMGDGKIPEDIIIKYIDEFNEIFRDVPWRNVKTLDLLGNDSSFMLIVRTTNYTQQRVGVHVDSMYFISDFAPPALFYQSQPFLLQTT